MQEIEVSADGSQSAENAVVIEGQDPQTQATQPKEGKASFQFLASRPVKIESPDEMKAVVERHQQWIASVLNPRADVMEGRANISGSDVSGYDLTGFDLRGVNFSRCIMRGTILQNCNLNGANLSYADLQGADLQGASVKRTIFDHADLREAELEGVDLSVASLSHTTMTTKVEEVAVPEAMSLEVEMVQSLDESSSANATPGSSGFVDRNESVPDSSI